MTQTISILAQSVIESVSSIVYGKLRSKLVKQGFSEISLFKHIADHCDENFIDPLTLVDETVTVIKECGRNMNYLNTSNIFPFLRGQFHQLRYGNLQLSEPKCPEQKGKFLCNKCYTICDKKDRSGQKTTPNSCLTCVSLVAKAGKARRDAQPPKLVERVKPDLEPEDLVPVDTEIQEPVIIIPEDEPMPKEIAPTTSVRITEVMSDEKNATVTVVCSPKELYRVLTALNAVVA